MRVTLASERRWPYIRSARWSRSLCGHPLFRRCAGRNGGVRICLKPSQEQLCSGAEITVRTLPASERRWPCTTVRGISGGAPCAMGEGAIPRPLAEKSTRRCGLSSGESRCPAHGASGAFLRSIKKKRAAFFLKSMRCGRSNPCENELKSCNCETVMT